MPAVARTSRESIVVAARGILERAGLDGLTMQAVAAAVGVQAPSLYKHVADRGQLMRLVLDATVGDLGGQLRQVPPGPASERIVWLAHRFRSFGHQQPAAFGLLFASLPDAWRSDPVVNADAVRPLIDAVAELVGPDHVLDASRALTASCVGFVTMELAGAFRLGGSVEDAWEFLVETLVVALGDAGIRPTHGSGHRSSRG
jgi:AcrR family transcriptional regulator